jgi:hypothetical protein
MISCGFGSFIENFTFKTEEASRINNVEIKLLRWDK